MTYRSGAGVTAVVLARNEEAHLRDCLASLRWAGSTIVLDSGSTDATIRIAGECGARVATHTFDNFSRQRQHALTLVETQWVLFVDADERVPPELAREVLAAAQAETHRAYWIPRRNYFWGKLIRGGGWWPDCQLRLLAVGHCRYDPDRAVHEVAEVDGPIGRLTAPLVHLNYDDWAEFRSRQLEYAALEAERRVAVGARPRAHNYVLQPMREFYRRYVALGGWRDGVTGLALCAAMAWYELVALTNTARLGPQATRRSSGR